MISVALVAVYDTERVDPPGRKVHHPQVALLMPDGEGAIVGDGVKQVSAVGGYFRMAYRQLLSSVNIPVGIDEGIDFITNRSRCLIEGDAQEAVL